MNATPVILTELETALLEANKWNEHVPLEAVQTALVRAGVYVSWAREEMARLTRELDDARAELAENEGVLAVWRRRCETAEKERDEAISDRHQLRSRPYNGGV